MRAWRALALGVAGARAAVLAVNAVAWPRLAPDDAGTEAPARVSLLVPARDEAHNLPRCLPGLLAQGAAEVLVLDDHSTDGTAQVARELGARVLEGAPLPEGWLGKPWACRQLAQAATGDVLVFVDADVTWRPGALAAVLAALPGNDLVSVIPRADAHGGARIMAPLVDAVVLTFVPAPLVRLRHPQAVVAHGATLAFRREAYERIGGHGAVAGLVMEDVELARAVKAAGGRVTTLLGGDLVSVRMYRTYAESVRGFAKNAVQVHLGSVPMTLGSWALYATCSTLPWLVPARDATGWVLRAASLLDRPAVSWLTRRRRPLDLAEGLLGPVTPLLAAPAYLLALRRTNTWKGRPVRSR